MNTLADTLLSCRRMDGSWDLQQAFRITPVFSDLPEEALESFAQITDILTLHTGSSLVDEGTEAYYFYLILEGRVKVQLESIAPPMTISINKLDPGEVIGERSLIDNTPHSVTLIAMESVDVARIKAEAMKEILDAHSEWKATLHRRLCLILSDRLKSMNRRMMNFIRARYY